MAEENMHPYGVACLLKGTSSKSDDDDIIIFRTIIHPAIG